MVAARRTGSLHTAISSDVTIQTGGNYPVGLSPRAARREIALYSNTKICFGPLSLVGLHPIRSISYCCCQSFTVSTVPSNRPCAVLFIDLTRAAKPTQQPCALPIDGVRRNLRFFPRQIFNDRKKFSKVGFKAWPRTKRACKFRGDPLRVGRDCREQLPWKT